MGTNKLFEGDTNNIQQEVLEIIDVKKKKNQMPQLWDGATGQRIVEIIDKWFFAS